MLIALMVISFDDHLFVRCVGRQLPYRGPAAAAVRMALAIPCSVQYLRGSPGQLAALAFLWLPVPFAVLQILWMRRHGAYWTAVRERERARRAEKRAAAVAATMETNEPSAKGQ